MTLVDGDEANRTRLPATNVTVSSATGIDLSVGANATSPLRSVADVVSMAATAPDGCQGVTFSITLDLTGAQV